MIHETVDYLGLRAKDKITGIEGVVTSVCFDLYGCVQAALNPGQDKDGKLRDSHWYDVQRLQLLPGDRVLPIPAFTARAESPAAYDRGPAEKPSPRT